MSIHADIALRNLKLLRFNFESHTIPSKPESFYRFLKEYHKTELLAIIKFLLHSLDSAYLDQCLSQHACPTSEAAFKAVATKWFRSLGPKLKMPVTFFQVTGRCGGPTAARFLSVLSTFVLESRLTVSVSNDHPQAIEHLVVQRQAHEKSYQLCKRYFEPILARYDTALGAIQPKLLSVKNLAVNFKPKYQHPPLPASFDWESGPPPEFIAYHDQLLSRVSSNRAKLEALLNDHENTRAHYRAFYHHYLHADRPVLRLADVKTVRTPELLLAAGSTQPVNSPDETFQTFSSLLRRTDLLFALLYRLLKRHGLPRMTDSPADPLNDSMAACSTRLMQLALKSPSQLLLSPTVGRGEKSPIQSDSIASVKPAGPASDFNVPTASTPLRSIENTSLAKISMRTMTVSDKENSCAHISLDHTKDNFDLLDDNDSFIADLLPSSPVL